MGLPAKKGDSVIYNLKIFLNKGDEVPLNQRQAEYLPVQMIRTVDGYRFVDHKTVLGNREAMAVWNIRSSETGKVRVNPHLAYRDEGLGDLIPANAVLIVELWLREIFTRKLEVDAR